MMKNSTPPGAAAESILFDLYAAFSILIFLTAGTFTFSDEVREILRQKPWLHRTAIMFITLSALTWYALRTRWTAVQPSRILKFIASLPLNPRQWTFFLFFMAFLVWTASAWARFEVFHTSFDMAIFAQAVWNSAQGDWFYSSIKGGINLLGDHFSPVLALLVLPYRIYPDPRTLLTIQSLAAAAAIFPVHAIAARVLNDPRKALVFVIGYILYLPAVNAVRFDFHPEVLAIPAILGAFYYLMTRRLVLASLLLLFCLTTKESAAVAIFGLGFYAFFFMQEMLFGFGWMVLSAVYFFAVIKLMPFMFGQDYFYLSANFLAWHDLGSAALARHLLQPSTAAYFIKVFAPLGFLSFLSPAAILTLPMLAQNLVARNEMTRSIFFQYTAYLTPFVFISAIYGSRKIFAHRAGALYLTACILLTAGVSELHVIREHLQKRQPRYAAWKDYLRSFPSGLSVRTHEHLATHLANRRELYIYENQHPKEGASYKALHTDRVILRDDWLGDKPAETLLQLEKTGYKLVHESQGLRTYAKDGA